MYIDVSGYTSFTIYINSYTGSEANYDYTLAFKPDYDVTSNPSGSSTNSTVYGTTYGFSNTPPSSTNIGNTSAWRKVTYTLDGGNHYIVVCFRKDSVYGYGWDRGYVAIPKNQ